MNPLSSVLYISDSSHVGEVRRAVQAIAKDCSFSEEAMGKIAIIATELAGNVIKHAGSGKIVLRPTTNGQIEILALDCGKGMSDIDKCMEDGYSTAGSPGTGLGAVQRLSDVFDIYSFPDKGTAIFVQSGELKDKECKHFLIGVICIPLKGETKCGDAWWVGEYEQTLRILVADGLGHGEYAAEASEQAVEIFSKTKQQQPVDSMNEIHGALRSTRGAAAAITIIDTQNSIVRFAGVGNIAGFVLGSDRNRGLTSYNGILGHKLHKVKEIELPWAQNGLLILHSDGLGSRWKLDDYPGLKQRHPALIAGVLYRDFERERDDVTVLIVKEAA